MESIQSEIMEALADIDKIIISNPTTSIKNVYDQKEIELVNKFGPELVAAYWPEFESKDSAYFAHKNTRRLQANYDKKIFFIKSYR